ncbi:MAG: hypothetical protein JWP87_2602 [Labilithrix sp.]|nr:hypothetical protein [Labilithrix sp.]
MSSHTNDTQPVLVDASAAAANAKRDSVVDDVFDTVTAWAAQGLVVAKRGLEASAKWLDAQAKVVGELANKLGTPQH